VTAVQQWWLGAAPAVGIGIPLVLLATGGTSGNSGLTSANALTVSGLDSAASYRVILDPSGSGAWSRYDLDGDGPGGLAWQTVFYATRGGYTEGFNGPNTVMLGSNTYYANAALAKAAYNPAAVILTGSAVWQFWLYDDVLADNRGDLALILEQLP